MAQDISIKYTDEIYLSKAKLQEVLNTSLVDGYWKEIRSYRGAYAHRLNVKTLRKDFQMGIILTPAIVGKISLLEIEIEKLLTNIKKKLSFKEKEEAEKILYFENLASLVRIHNISFSEVALKQLVSGRYRGEDASHKPVIDLYRVLSNLVSHEPSEPDERFLGEVYSNLLNSELTSFYRTSDFDNRAKLAEQRDTDYPYAPFEKIEPAMDNLLKAIENEEIKPIIRSLLAIYYLDAVAPFNSKNKELALLLSLDVLANKYGAEAFYLPFLTLLEDNEKRREAISGVRTGDFTYFVLYAVDILRSKVSELNKGVEEILLSQYREEANYLTKEEEKSSFSNEPEQMSFFDHLEEEEPKKVEVKPAPVKKVEVKPLPKKELVRPEIVKKTVEPVEGEISISMERRSLSDKEAKEYTQYLLESNPNLNKKQASFLATHCTLGHYYTIQQYKKFARCAYETARTSMDKLAAENYYEKRQIKNKYVYTPVNLNAK